MVYWKYYIFKNAEMFRSVSLSEIAKTENMSLSPRDYLKPPVIIYSDFGFETEEDAKEDAYSRIQKRSSDPSCYKFLTMQVEQEDSYMRPTQVIFFDPDPQECHAGIAYDDVVICAECGCTFELDEVEILEELDWTDIEHSIAGGKALELTLDFDNIREEDLE